MIDQQEGNSADADDGRGARPSPAIRFLIIDDHPLVTFALLHLIEAQQGWSVGLHTASPREAMDAVREHGFDVALIDLLFPDESGIEFVHWLSREAPATRAIVYSMQRADIYARRCVQCGATGYVGKESPVEVLLATIAGTLHGHTMINGKALGPQDVAALRARGQSGIDRLSRRELEVLTLLGQGLSNSRIAQILCRSAKTIESHRYRIAHKLEIENGPPLVHYAMQHRLAGSLSPSDTTEPRAQHHPEGEASHAPRARG